MKGLHYLTTFLVLLHIFFSLGCSEKGKDSTKDSSSLATKTIALFNGYNFDGWDVNTDYFFIEDSAIVAGKLNGPNEKMLWVTTKKQYADFILEVDVKLIGGDEEETANGGIYFRCHYDKYFLGWRDRAENAEI